VSTLAGLFRETTNSYKFLFFRAILEQLPSGSEVDPVPPLLLRTLAIEMAALAWYSHRYYRLSFGASDQIGAILDRLEFSGDGRRAATPFFQESLRQAIRQQTDRIGLLNLLHYVPQRLLVPFFREEVRGIHDYGRDKLISKLATDKFGSNAPLYKFVDVNGEPAIALHPSWVEYLLRNREIVLGWTHWNFLRFLQRRNPSTPALSSKLSPPLARLSLEPQKNFWDKIMEETEIRCIYSGEPLNGREFALDHFVPWSFVCHNENWNLVPTAPAANQAKSDSLPAREYLDAFIAVQTTALRMVAELGSKRLPRWARPVEDYESGLRLPRGDFADAGRIRESLRSTIEPLLSIAEQSGFPVGWKWGERPGLLEAQRHGSG
jgi:hypothetical protein